MNRILRRLKPQTPTTDPSLLRHLTISPISSGSPPPPLPKTDDPSLVSKVATLLEATHPNDWTTNAHLRHLLFPPSPSPVPTPLSLLRITRRLPTTAAALNFYEYIATPSPSPPDPQFLSSIFQAIFEIASREQQPDAKLDEILAMSKRLNIPLTVNSAILLVKSFGEAGMVDKSLLVYNELDPDRRNTHVRNAVVGVLLKSGRVDDALHLLDEMLESGAEFRPNKKTMDVVFSALKKGDWVGRKLSAEEIVGLVSRFRENGLPLSKFLLGQLVVKLCRIGSSNRAWELLHEIMKLGSKHVDVGSCNALLTCLSREQEFEKINIILKEIKENNVQPNVVTFGILINHYCKFRRMDNALEVFKNIKEGSDGISVRPDVIIFNTLIDGLCKVGRQREALDLMDQMRLEHGCMPNSVTYNCLIDGFCKAGEIDRARELFDRMKEEGIRPNVITLNILVDGMCKNGMISSATEFFNEMQEKGLKGNAVTYTALINAFCNANNIDKAMNLFDEMSKSGCIPDVRAYYTLVFGLCQAGRVDDASFIASMAKKAGFGLDTICYNALIGGFCRKGKMDRAYEMLKNMEQEGVKPDTVTYNTLISYFSKAGDFETAHRLMKKMINDGFVPTVVTYGALINSFCLVGNLDEGMKIFRDMSSTSRVPPNTVIYNILIDSLCKNQKVDVALSLMDDMKTKGVRPNTTTFNAMFKGLCEKNLLEIALKFMDQMTEEACDPDYITMEILTDWLSSVGKIEKLRSFVQGYQVSNSTAESALLNGKLGS
ncbi:hypothetical protein RJ640_006176 [Escallonia rubra]|uniref:Pentatricopeptide repeat-containing protein n=1 Tax=Escallonia rubra TaxID=112253 RepID=A0AA88UWU2_9ASTE|nr:hypothetical protein RJ640_006176 [Escallonia rubra]